MADECDDESCGAVFPQGHLSGCRNVSRPPKGRAGWDANAADAGPERQQWEIVLDFTGTEHEASKFFDALHDFVVEDGWEPTGRGSYGMDGASMRKIDQEVWNVDA